VRRQRDRCRRRKRRNEPKAAQAVKRGVRRPGKEGRQRRLVHITPGEIPPTDDVIELVAEIAIIVIDPKMEEERRQPERGRRMVEKRAETKHQALYFDPHRAAST
jgi:hypothetical protein